MSNFWGELTAHLSAGNDLTPDLAQSAMAQILEGQASEDSIKEFLISLKNKGESSTDISLLASQLLKYSLPIQISERAVDPVGTGGDGKNTVNISTSAAIVTTAAGARVVKHGSIAASSKSGAADVLAALEIGRAHV